MFSPAACTTRRSFSTVRRRAGPDRAAWTACCWTCARSGSEARAGRVRIGPGRGGGGGVLDIALVGLASSGKSTLLRALAAGHLPHHGGVHEPAVAVVKVPDERLDRLGGR